MSRRNHVHPIFQPIIDALAPKAEVVSIRRHVESADCWCKPALDYVNEETGVKHWIHHEPN
jgi:hypothetical protein